MLLCVTLSLVDRMKTDFCLFLQGLPGKDGLSGRQGDKGETGIVGMRGIKVFSVCVCVFVCARVHMRHSVCSFCVVATLKQFSGV